MHWYGVHWSPCSAPGELCHRCAGPIGEILGGVASTSTTRRAPQGDGACEDVPRQISLEHGLHDGLVGLLNQRCFGFGEGFRAAQS
jgi:hypothetical protein